MTYLSDSVMLDALKKVQALQLEILASGHSAHIDANVHPNSPFEHGTHISFELTIFEGNDIIRSFDFNAIDSEEVINGTCNIAVAYTKYLKAHV